jgi:hypothetical protein
MRTTHLAAADAQPQRLHKLVHVAHREPAHVCLLNDRKNARSTRLRGADSPCGT